MALKESGNAKVEGETPDWILLEVLACFDIASQEWSYLKKHISPNSPPQKIIKLADESVALVKKLAPTKLVRKAPDHAFVVSRTDIPTGRHVLFSFIVNGKFSNIGTILNDVMA